MLNNNLVQLLVILVTTIAISVLYVESQFLEKVIFTFYYPCIVSSINIMGGMHGAPEWSVYLGIFIENLIIWYFLRFIIRSYSEIKQIKNT